MTLPSQSKNESIRWLNARSALLAALGSSSPVVFQFPDQEEARATLLLLERLLLRTRFDRESLSLECQDNCLTLSWITTT